MVDVQVFFFEDLKLGIFIICEKIMYGVYYSVFVVFLVLKKGLCFEF